MEVEFPEIPPGTLRVYEVGELTTVGFGGQDIPDEVCVAGYREQLQQLLKQHDCKVLTFDCTGVLLMPSGMLGLLSSLRKQVPQIVLRNPSPDVTSVLRITGLGQFFEIRHLDDALPM